VADRLIIEHIDRHRDHVVTADDARIGQTLLRPDCPLRSGYPGSCG
jgi:hypothetical protein